ncbi:MAG: benzoate 1,2-dioxygenase small subunit [Neisseriaceae bacterium]|nr:benzoate 1,2-dioxygenase small subunit [Neisseriaceae bacterium]
MPQGVFLWSRLKHWDEWPDGGHEQVEFWLSSWDDDDALVSDPQREISLIYYPSKEGLEDRVFRIRTDRSSATMPDTRTSHNISNIEILGRDPQTLTVRFNWHTLSHRYQTDYAYFGYSVYDLVLRDGQPLITRKYVVLKNDDIHQVIDVYHI